MSIRCPHCGATYFTFGYLVGRSMMLRGVGAPLRCANCGGQSYVTLTGPNSLWAAVILVLGFLASYHSAFSDSLMGGLAAQTAAMIRLGIWAIALLSASAVFTFVSPLKKIDPELAWNRYRDPLLFVMPYIFYVLVLFYDYFLYEAVRHSG
jgi:hypothetical protein